MFLHFWLVYIFHDLTLPFTASRIIEKPSIGFMANEAINSLI